MKNLNYHQKFEEADILSEIPVDVLQTLNMYKKNLAIFYNRKEITHLRKKSSNFIGRRSMVQS